jgi:glucose-6-phosphate 1-dehydrogenase
MNRYEGYTFEDDVPNTSTTETYAQAVFKIDNSRWRGVPFIVKCAKAVNERKCEIRVQFEESPLPYYRCVQLFNLSRSFVPGFLSFSDASVD